MKREIITTADGSKTIRIADWNEQYHSVHGAIQESQHVFIKNGLDFVLNHIRSGQIDILEYGFGTGLNAFLTLLYLQNTDLSCSYMGIEAYPVEKSELALLNYTDTSDSMQEEIYQQMHDSAWEEWVDITQDFKLLKNKARFEDFNLNKKFDLIYFDAFGARVQPELWTVDIFRNAYEALKENGCLVTYSSKGSVKRAMIASGFRIEKLQGPPGKRHMLRAVKGW